MATISWISTTGGDWSDGANWQGGVVPGANDDAVIHMTAAETITVSSRVAIHDVLFDDLNSAFVMTSTGGLVASGSVTICANTVTFASSASLTAAGSVTFQSGPQATIGEVGTPFLVGTIGGIEAGIGTLDAGGITPGELRIGTFGTNEPAALLPPLGDIYLADPATLELDWLPSPRPILTVAPLSETPIYLQIDTIPASAGDTQPAFVPGASGHEWAVPAASLPVFNDGVPTVSGSGDGAVLFNPHIFPEVLAAGAGNETLTAGIGGDTCVAGTGTTFMNGGPGATLFMFTNGPANATSTVSDFIPGEDFVALRNYGSGAVEATLATATTASGSTTITLPDNSRVTFMNVSGLTPGDFR